MKIKPDGLNCERVSLIPYTFSCPGGVCSNPGSSGVDLDVPNADSGASTSILIKQTKAELDDVKKRLDTLEAKVGGISG